MPDTARRRPKRTTRLKELLQLKVKQGKHSISVFSSWCHVRECGTLSRAAASYWSQCDRAELLSPGTGKAFDEVMMEWSVEKYGEPPEMGSIEYDDMIDLEGEEGEEQVHRGVIFQIPSTFFDFKDDLEGKKLLETHMRKTSSYVTGERKCSMLEIPLSDLVQRVCKNSDGIMWEDSFFPPQNLPCSWDHTLGFKNNEGTLTINIEVESTLQSFLLENMNICVSNTEHTNTELDNEDLCATDINLGKDSIDWELGINKTSKCVVCGPGSIGTINETPHSEEYNEKFDTVLLSENINAIRLLTI